MLMIFDLDGTILSINSFRPWALFLLKARFDHLGVARRCAVSARAFSVLTARKLGLINHDACKWRLQNLWQEATAGDGGRAAHRLSLELMSFVRPEIREPLSWISDARVAAVMATAAAGDYAEHFGKMLGFSHILATPAGRTREAPENVGERKLQTVTDLIFEHKWGARPRVLFTDHEDDLPLIGICDTVFWFGSEAQRQRVKAVLPGAKLHLPESQLRSHVQSQVLCKVVSCS
jgi:phosphoserine phosphatase